MLAKLRPDGFTIALLTVVVLATILPARGAAADTFAIITRLAIMLLFFMHGAKLSREAIIRGAGAVKLHMSAFSVTYIVFPLIALAVALVPEQLISADIKAGLLFLAVLPSTIQSSIAFTSIGHGNVAAAVCSASLSNVVGVFLTPLLAGILIHTEDMNGDLDTVAAIRSVVITLLVPFIVGHLSRPLIGGIVDRHKAALGKLDRGSILLVVYAAFSAAVVDGLWSRVSGTDLAIIAALSATLLAAVLTISLAIARSLRLSREDRVALVFCGSTKSLATGVPIAAALFSAPIVGMLILPLMVYHQIQLIVCAVIARFYADHPNGARS